jgi:predicted nucleic acid-binding protein
MGPAATPEGLTDSDVLIDAIRGVPDAVNFLATQNAEPGIRASVISCMELVAGCRNGRELADLQQMFRQMVVVQVTSAISDRAFSLMQSWRLSHGLQIADALIAASALENGLPLFTRNVRHFQMIPGLVVTKPY